MSGMAMASIWPAISAWATVESSSKRTISMSGTAILVSAASWLEPRLTPTRLPESSSSLPMRGPLRRRDHHPEGAVGHREHHGARPRRRRRQRGHEEVDLAGLEGRDAGRRRQRHELGRHAEILGHEVGDIDVVAGGVAALVDGAERRGAGQHADPHLAGRDDVVHALCCGRGRARGGAGGRARQQRPAAVPATRRPAPASQLFHEVDKVIVRLLFAAAVRVA